jgi:hypothetical protein
MMWSVHSRRRMRGDVDVQDPARSVMQNDKDEQVLGRDGGHGEEVAGDGGGHVVLEERPPTLAMLWISVAHPVFVDRGLSDFVAEQRQFVMDAEGLPR